MKIYKVYLFGNIIFETEDILSAQIYKSTFSKKLIKYIEIK
jgi:hypothetical protein